MDQPGEDQKEAEGELYGRGAGYCFYAFGWGSAIAGLLSFAFVAVAFTQAGVGLYKYLLGIWAGATHEQTQVEDASIILILHALEVLLVAPLPFLILSSIASFVGEWEIRRGVSDKTRTKFEDTKMLLYGIFVGVLTLDFIGKAVSNKLTLPGTAIELAGIFLVAAILYAAEWTCLWRQNSTGGTRQPDEPSEANNSSNKPSPSV